MENDLSIIIVNYNTINLLSRCLRSIFNNKEDLKIEIVVIDNCSGDNSVKIIKKKFTKVKIIANKKI